MNSKMTPGDAPATAPKPEAPQSDMLQHHGRPAPSAPAEVDGLVERAYRLANWCEGAGQRDSSEAASTLRELGSALTTLQADRDEARAALRKEGDA